ncbi:MAG: transcription elongation factor GreA [Chitinispirillales bacterium]|jgi:transcription elongation factor GreA|nr:transcription elongation factor GreA [Chitinispirillales bacterium]
MERICLTRKEYEDCAAELEQLQTVKRREIAAQLDLARSHGDLSENAEYEAAKHALQLNEIRISELQGKIATADIIDIENISTDKVVIGTKVTLWDFTYNEEVEYRITGAEADPEAGKISASSPIAKALFGHSAGDTVEIKAPRGTMKFEIKKISL